MSCSNRSAALLQLKKSGKALEDAEQCIKRRPDWDKGFFRKGLALELADRYPEVTPPLPVSSISQWWRVHEMFRPPLIASTEQ